MSDFAVNLALRSAGLDVQAVAPSVSAMIASEPSFFPSQAPAPAPPAAQMHSPPGPVVQRKAGPPPPPTPVAPAAPASIPGPAAQAETVSAPPAPVADASPAPRMVTAPASQHVPPSVPAMPIPPAQVRVERTVEMRTVEVHADAKPAPPAPREPVQLEPPAPPIAEPPAVSKSVALVLPETPPSALRPVAPAEPAVQPLGRTAEAYTGQQPLQAAPPTPRPEEEPAQPRPLAAPPQPAAKPANQLSPSPAAQLPKAPERRAVKISIGRIDVRMPSATPPAPSAPEPAEPEGFDEFDAWRTYRIPVRW